MKFCIGHGNNTISSAQMYGCSLTLVWFGNLETIAPRLCTKMNTAVLATSTQFYLVAKDLR